MSDDALEADIAAVSAIDAVPKILEVVCRSTGMGFAAVARVTESRWVACAVRDQIGFGLAPGGELAIATTICDRIRDTGEAVIIDDVPADADFCGHPTPALYGFRSYISVPVRHEGRFFGTLCAIDPEPRELKNSTAPEVFALFAELIGAHLAARERYEASQRDLLSSREAEELREQFIGVLGHDLRNPLAAIDAGVRLMRKTPLDARATVLLGGMEKSVRRMASLIDNVLDLARGRLGGGFVIERQAEIDLEPALTQVIDELQLAHPNREIRSDLQIGRPIAADPRRLAQLLSNLIANALTHGERNAPVVVRGRLAGDVLDLSVSNTGEPIAGAALGRLFQPFSRAALRPQAEGLGLGLWICAEIARAHGGELTVRSDAEETRFTLQMPVEAAALAAAQ